MSRVQATKVQVHASLRRTFEPLIKKMIPTPSRSRVMCQAQVNVRNKNKNKNSRQWGMISSLLLRIRRGFRWSACLPVLPVCTITKKRKKRYRCIIRQAQISTTHSNEKKMKKTVTLYHTAAANFSHTRQGCIKRQRQISTTLSD